MWISKQDEEENGDTDREREKRTEFIIFILFLFTAIGLLAYLSDDDEPKEVLLLAYHRVRYHLNGNLITSITNI